MKGNNQVQKISLEEIEKKRMDMLNEAKLYGITSPTVLKKSEELDKLIIDYMRE